MPVYNASDPSTYDKTGKPLRSATFCAEAAGESEHLTQHYTIVFNVFVLMQVFNEINSRKIHNEINVFDGVFKNAFFLVIVVGTFVVQYLLIEIQGLNTAFGCTNLTKDQWIACMLLVLFLYARFQMIISAQFSHYMLSLYAVH
jgi:magnesium-transporting ATPase (P-type)